MVGGLRVRDEDLVIGLVAGGQAFAYPINMLTGPSREIINDTVGAVSYTHLTLPTKA